MYTNTTEKKVVKGFTLIEILLVIALIAILATATIVALNPTRQFSQANNSTRTSHVNAILSGINQYALDHKGQLPEMIPTSNDCGSEATQEICITGASCVDSVALNELTDAEVYMTTIPIDPLCETIDRTCYFVVVNNTGRVTVCAPATEGGTMISVTR